MAKLTYTGAEVQSLLDKVNGISGGGGSIEYPLSWSGYSQGVWDGSAPANIAIPSLLSQLTNDSDYITSASVNSLLTDYLSKSGGTITGDFFLKKSGNATIIFQPSNAAKNFGIGVNTSEEWFCTNGGYTETYKLIHSGNFSVYGGVWLANAEFNANAIHHGFRAGKAYNAKGLIDAYRGFLEYGFDGYAAQFNSNSENDLFYRWCENGTWLNWRKVAFVDTDSLTPSSGLLTVNGNISATTFLPTGDTAIQFPDGEYIDRYGNIVLPSTASQWSVKHGSNIIMKANANLLQVNGNLLATGEITQHSSLELKDVADTRFLTLKELVVLKPYSFRWKDGRDDKLHAGAIADYVMPILPEVISTDKDNIHSMNYANAAWVVGTSLTPYVSKHEEEIEKLKERVKYLENKLKKC